MRSIVLLGLVVAIVALVLAAAPAPATKPTVDLRSVGVQPLAYDKVDWLFGKIARKERVEADVLHAALIGPQTALRADAARILAQWGDGSSIPHLIHALADESSHVGANYPDAGMATTRYWAAKSLREMTGRDFGFVWNDPLDKRNAAVLGWSTWYQTVKADDAAAR
jgi:hypothetical protein